MLQNKISSLDKFSNLGKQKDDDKIAELITKLLNSMADLSKLAADNNLECELYYGGGIHKILDLLGKQRQRKFIKETAKAKINDREKWAKLVNAVNEKHIPSLRKYVTPPAGEYVIA